MYKYNNERQINLNCDGSGENESSIITGLLKFINPMITIM